MLRKSLPLQQVTTASLQALRLYSRAIEIGDIQGNNREAIPLLQAAVALDSTFAMAYRKLGTYLSESGEQDAATDAIQRAFRQRAHLPELERYSTLGSYYLFPPVPASAIAPYRALRSSAPATTRSLQECVGLPVSSLTHSRRTPSALANRSARISRVNPGWVFGCSSTSAGTGTILR